MNEWFEKLSVFIFSREVAIELIKVAFTAVFGFITFKIYQMYRNKKDNSKLYIQIIKLEREFIGNLQIIQDIIDNGTFNEKNEYSKLLFNVRNNFKTSIVELFELFGKFALTKQMPFDTIGFGDYERTFFCKY